MGRPKKYTKLVRLYVDEQTAATLDQFPNLNQSDALRYLIGLGADKVSLHSMSTEEEIRKLSEVVIHLHAEIAKLKEVVAILVKERGGL